LDPLTHLLTGACMSRAGLNRMTALTTPTLVIAAEASDIDVVAYFRGSAVGFAHHRGITHTFVGVPLVAALVVGFVFICHRLKNRRDPAASSRPRWGLLFVFSCLAGLSHILLDYTTAYGVRPFEPFSYRWYAWDIVSIVEPVLLLVLIAALVLPALGSLISSEIGVRCKEPRGRLAAILALAAMAGTWAMRDYEHRRAMAAIQARTYEGAEPVRFSAFPYTVNPFKWMGVVETQNFFENMHVDSLTPDVDPDNNARIRYRPQEAAVTLAAKKSYLGRVYLDWARYPITETEELAPPQKGYVVRFYDLRYMFPERAGSPLSAVVVLDENLNVVEQRMSARGERAGRAGH
jgi:inner membrane protein